MKTAQDHARDLDHPDFPHGTVTGNNRGCLVDSPCPATPTCHQRKARARKARLLRKAGLRPPAPTDRVPFEKIRSHVEELFAVEGATLALIGELAGLPATSISNLKNRGLSSVSLATYRRLKRVTPEMLRAELGPTPRKVRQLVWSMQAQGWPVKWQAEKVGHTATWAFKIRLGRSIPLPEDAKAIAALAEQMEGKTGPCAESAGRARRAGWHGLDCYDEHGNLVPEWVPDEKRAAQWERRTARAQMVIDVLWHKLTTEDSAKETAALFGTYTEDVHRMCQKLGIGFAPGPQKSVLISEETRPRADEVIELLREQRQLLLDPIDFVTERLGINIKTGPKTEKQAA